MTTFVLGCVFSAGLAWSFVTARVCMVITNHVTDNDTVPDPAFEAIVRRGRIRGLGVVLITQRPERPARTRTAVDARC